MTPKDLERFNKKVHKDEKTGCWVWTGAITGGHGAFHFNRKLCRAHRVMWEHENGPIPDAMCVLHDCPSGDNPLCVNPDHLYLGTHQDNMIDIATKGSFSGKTVPSEVCNSLEDIFT
jgi:hypothetical protein